MRWLCALSETSYLHHQKKLVCSAPTRSCRYGGSSSACCTVLPPEDEAQSKENRPYRHVNSRQQGGNSNFHALLLSSTAHNSPVVRSFPYSARRAPLQFGGSSPITIASLAIYESKRLLHTKENSAYAYAADVATSTNTRNAFSPMQPTMAMRRPRPTRAAVVDASPKPAVVSSSIDNNERTPHAQSAYMYIGHITRSHEARKEFVELANQLVWASTFASVEATTATTETTEHDDEQHEADCSSLSPSSSMASSVTLEKMIDTFTEATQDLVDVVKKQENLPPSLVSNSTPLSSLSSPKEAAEQITMMVWSTESEETVEGCRQYPSLCSAYASFVKVLEDREALVAFVEAMARVLQCDALHKMVENCSTTLPSAGTQVESTAGNKKVAAAAAAAATGEGMDLPKETEVPKEGQKGRETETTTPSTKRIHVKAEEFIPLLRTTAINTAAYLLPHAAEAHDSVDEAVALLSCASAVLTLSPPMAERAEIRKLLVPATIVCRRLIGTDMASLMLCLARVYDASPPPPPSPKHASAPSRAAGVAGGAAFLSYSSLADLKTLELELFRRFNAAFAKYTPPPLRSAKSPAGPLSTEQREAHRRQFIAARKRALLTLTDVAEIASAFAIHRFVGSKDMAIGDGASLATCGGGSDGVGKLDSASSSYSSSAAPRSDPLTTPADSSQLWGRIVQYTIDFISHDLRLAEESKAASEAAELETLSLMMGDGEDGENVRLLATKDAQKGEKGAVSVEEEEEDSKRENDFIDTTFTKADIQSICFALDRVGCHSGYDKLMDFLVEKGILRERIEPPSVYFR